MGGKSGMQRRVKALIVEDTVELAEVIQLTLERMGLEVYHETHGLKALDSYEIHEPALVLLDIALPDMMGWKVLDTIREQQRGGKFPLIIVITAYGDAANRLMGRLQGVEDYLVKPLTPDEIEHAVARALDKLQRGTQD
ncbi:MAG: response regulator [Chloroflexi bacterium]|jgi:two-component system OmpR family response regulator|nr:response regulator [Chloroflexota bacterium]